jgi:hypothetical protein
MGEITLSLGWGLITKNEGSPHALKKSRVLCQH